MEVDYLLKFMKTWYHTIRLILTGYQREQDLERLYEQGYQTQKQKKIIRKIRKPKCGTVYIVTVITELTYNKYVENLLPAGTWTVGIFKNYKEACKALKENRTDIWETVYDYGVIEEVDLNALYPSLATNWTEWYKYSQKLDGYFPTDVPETLENYNGIW
jgi:hypothetical protein